jgi:flagellar assembly protein FliH
MTAQRTPKARTPSALTDILPRLHVAARPSWIGPSSSLEPRPAFVSPEPTPSARLDPSTAATTTGDIRIRAEKEGIEAAKSKVETIMGRYFDAIANLEKTRQEIAGPYTESSLDLALQIAREILDREIRIDGGNLEARIRESLEAIGPDRPVRIRLSPVEIEHAVRRAPDLLGEGIELVEDDSLGIGGCVVESPSRIVDASVETRLAAIRDAIAEELARDHADAKGAADAQ